MKDFLLKNLWILKFVKFCLVGASGLIIDFGITYTLKEKLKVQKFIANAVGFCTAATSNYILNRTWTFASTNPHITKEYSTFILISLAGLGLNTLILWILVTRFKMNFYLSKLIAIFFVTLWNFLLNFLVTFA